jgi:hypothetical protein
VATADELTLRLYLAESVPDAGSGADTLLSDAQVTALLSRAGGDLRRAAAEGWRIKAGLYADLVNASDGGSSRSLGDLQAHALAMAAEYGRSPRRVQLSRGELKVRAEGSS